MNAFKFNSMCGVLVRSVVCKQLDIHWTDVYKNVDNVKTNGEIHTKDGKIYKLQLKEITDES
jgi:hypothetical protein